MLRAARAADRSRCAIGDPRSPRARSIARTTPATRTITSVRVVDRLGDAVDPIAVTRKSCARPSLCA